MYYFYLKKSVEYANKLRYAWRFLSFFPLSKQKSRIFQCYLRINRDLARNSSAIKKKCRSSLLLSYQLAKLWYCLRHPIRYSRLRYPEPYRWYRDRWNNRSTAHRGRRHPLRCQCSCKDTENFNCAFYFLRKSLSNLIILLHLCSRLLRLNFIVLRL